MLPREYRSRRAGFSRFDAICIVAGCLIVTGLLLPFILH